MPRRPAVPIDPPLTATLGCGCIVAFRAGVEGSPVTVVVSKKAGGCAVSNHVGGLPIFDHREALRPSTRVVPPPHTDVEES